jgi:ferredoxin
MRVIIDAGLCQGHLRCMAKAPELFSCDDEGLGIAPDRKLDPAERTRAEAAVYACPEGAVTIVE